MEASEKIKTYCLLVAKMRTAQREFFSASVKKDFSRKAAILPQAKALEKKVDEQTKELLALADLDFKPELYR